MAALACCWVVVSSFTSRISCKMVVGAYKKMTYKKKGGAALVAALTCCCCAWVAVAAPFVLVLIPCCPDVLFIRIDFLK